jgi:putative SOS response-associated peptidase YedK
MCGRFTQAVSWEELARLYRITEGVPAMGSPAEGDVYPGTDVALVRAAGEGDTGHREVARLHWGFRPAWKKDRTAPINARAETLFESGMWRDSAAKRRCIVPADGFYEPIGPKRPKRPQVYFALPEQEVLSIAAVWVHWPGDERDPARDGFALVTTAANDTVGPYHARMPALLPGDAIDPWLDPGLRDRELLGALLRPWAGAPLTAREIGAGGPPPPAPGPSEPDLFS